MLARLTGWLMVTLVSEAVEAPLDRHLAFQHLAPDKDPLPPRLNAVQAPELSFLVTEELKKEQASRPRKLDDDESVEAAE